MPVPSKKKILDRFIDAFPPEFSEDIGQNGPRATLPDLFDSSTGLIKEQKEALEIIAEELNNKWQSWQNSLRNKVVQATGLGIGGWIGVAVTVPPDFGLTGDKFSLVINPFNNLDPVYRAWREAINVETDKAFGDWKDNFLFTNIPVAGISTATPLSPGVLNQGTIVPATGLPVASVGLSVNLSEPDKTTGTTLSSQSVSDIVEDLNGDFIKNEVINGDVLEIDSAPITDNEGYYEVINVLTPTKLQLNKGLVERNEFDFNITSGSFAPGDLIKAVVPGWTAVVDSIAGITMTIKDLVGPLPQSGDNFQKDAANKGTAITNAISSTYSNMSYKIKPAVGFGKLGVNIIDKLRNSGQFNNIDDPASYTKKWVLSYAKAVKNLFEDWKKDTKFRDLTWVDGSGPLSAGVGAGVLLPSNTNGTFK